MVPVQDKEAVDIVEEFVPRIQIPRHVVDDAAHKGVAGAFEIRHPLDPLLVQSHNLGARVWMEVCLGARVWMWECLLGARRTDM